MPTNYKTFTINVAPELHAELVELASERGVSITELIRQAVSFDKFMWRVKRS